MRNDYPDHKKLVFVLGLSIAGFAAMLVVVAIAFLILRPPNWVLPTAFGVVAAVEAAILAGVGWSWARETRRRRQTNNGPTQIAAAPIEPRRRGYAIAQLLFQAFAFAGLLLVISGLIAHLTALVLVGAVPFGLFLIVLGLVSPFRSARLAKSRKP